MKDQALQKLIELKGMDEKSFSFSIYTICGDARASLRQQMVLLLTGEIRPLNKCGFHVVRTLIERTSMESLQEKRKLTRVSKLKRKSK